MPVVPPKTIVGNGVSAKASQITNDAARIYGSLWKVKRINGIVIASEKRILDGGTRNATFITAEWSLPGRILIKELNGRLIEYVPDANGVEIVAEPLAEGDMGDAQVAHAAAVHALPEPIIESAVQAENEGADPPTPHYPPMPPLPVPPADPPVVDPAPVHAPIPIPVTAPPDAPTANSTNETPNRPSVPIAQVAHNTTWVIDDAASKRDINGAIPRRLWYLTDATGDRISENDHQKLESISLLDAFLLMFPPDHLIHIINLTNRKLRTANYLETSKGEIVKFFGIIILSTRFVFGRRRDLWKAKSASRLIDPPNFGCRTGMVRDRFDHLWSCIRFSDQTDEREEGMTSMAHRWMLVDDFVTAFNEYRASNYSPSDRICVDESISRWYGLGGHWINCGLPNYVATDRKPENGCEIQDACDGRSKVMIQLKLVKGAADNAQLESEDPSGLHGTRVMKQLVRPWANSGRVVAADSYFASVPCALALKNMGLRFIGVVKTATKGYPQQYLSTVELPAKGDYKGVLNIDPMTGYTLLAFVWVDRERRYFISNCCSLAQGSPYSRIRWRQVDHVGTQIEPDRLQITIPQPKCAEEYYSSCAMVDRHNRSRQQVLDIEKKLGTQRWDMRVNLSILSIIIVDTWCVVKGILGDRYEPNESEFYTKLAEEMIDNSLDTAQTTRSRTSHIVFATGPQSKLDTTDGRVSSGIGVHLTPTKKRRCMNGKQTNYLQQNWCSDCMGDKPFKTTYVCSECRDVDGKIKNLAFCHSKTGRLCFRRHVEEVHNLDIL